MKEYKESAKFELWSTANPIKKASGLYVYQLNPKTNNIEFKFRGPVKTILYKQARRFGKDQQFLDSLTRWQWFKLYLGLFLKAYFILKFTVWMFGHTGTYLIKQDQFENKSQIRWEFSKHDNETLKKRYGNLSNAKVQRKRVTEAAMKMFFDKKFFP